MIEGTIENFEGEVLKAEGVVVVDFNADWCGPCRAMAVTLEKLVEKMADLKVVSVNIDDQPELMNQYEVMSIPCLVVFRNGAEVMREVGMQSERRICKMIKEAQCMM